MFALQSWLKLIWSSSELAVTWFDALGVRLESLGSSGMFFRNSVSDVSDLLWELFEKFWTMDLETNLPETLNLFSWNFYLFSKILEISFTNINPTSIYMVDHSKISFQKKKKKSLPCLNYLEYQNSPLIYPQITFPLTSIWHEI